MFRSIDIRHWLASDGELPANNLRLRRQALRVARLIEAGGPLEPGQYRETLVDCTARPARKSCLGLVWVEKLADGRLEASCPACQRERVFIAGWEHTKWAGGPMGPASDADLVSSSAIVN